MAGQASAVLQWHQVLFLPDAAISQFTVIGALECANILRNHT